jgi:hypothetical protein
MLAFTIGKFGRGSTTARASSGRQGSQQYKIIIPNFGN